MTIFLETRRVYGLRYVSFYWSQPNLHLKWGSNTKKALK